MTGASFGGRVLQWGRMAMGKRKRDRQPAMWVTTTDLLTSASHPFYRRLNQLLREHGFDDFAEAQCAAFYAETMGRPSLPPGIYFRLLLIGYFEGIDSERGIAWRAADSLALRTVAVIEEVVADKGYHSRTMVRSGEAGDSHLYQRTRSGAPIMDPSKGGTRRGLCQSASHPGDRGKRLLRMRGELVERPCAHLYETGGLRRAHVRGHENVLKRLLVHAGAFNLALWMRSLGVRTDDAQGASRLCGFSGRERSRCRSTMRWRARCTSRRCSSEDRSSVTQT
jgi:hypothetical protein